VPSQYVYIWAFQVKPGCEARFEHIYGPQGAWVELFRKGPGYLRTELIKDLAMPNRYLTIDYWQDEASNQLFRRQFAQEFSKLDRHCEGFTESEELLGNFLTLTEDSARD
jgi:heme-degrading monooxygenase HmoA